VPAGPRRAAAAALASLALLALAGCGSSGPRVPHGNPDLRRGPQAVDSYAQVEFIRALVIASSDEYYAGGAADDARLQLTRAHTLYDQVAGRVRSADRVVDREVSARFGLVAKVLREGTPPDRYRDLAGPLADQLMDGVAQALVPQAARSDPGVAAEALRRVAVRMAADYDTSASALDETQARLAFEEAWGLWRRAQALQSILGNRLGGEQGLVKNTLGNLRNPAFPQGPLPPDQPNVKKVDSASLRIQTALARRFGLTAA
jgi:hypothetical protein